MSSSGHPRGIASGAVVALGMTVTALVLLVLCHVVGWDPAWRAFGVTPLQPPFFDMHVINDYAACAREGVDPYAPRACSAVNFNIPPTWLLVGSVGIDGSDTVWLSAAFIAAAAVVMVLLLRGRAWHHGLIALGAVLSPSVMMGVERGNLDLLVLALVGAAALIYDEGRIGRALGALVLLGIGVALKLIPIFCVSLAARGSRRTVIFAGALAALSLISLMLMIDDVFLIRRNVPTTFILSYGYKALFLGIDHVRSEASLSPMGLADTWLPALMVAVVVIWAAAVAFNSFRRGRMFCAVDVSTAGTAFLFGAGIYCGTYLLGTNFIYRLMFLLLCAPQLLDWQTRKREGDKSVGIAELGLLVTVLGVLWSNGNSNGHSVFLLLPQLLDWFLFAGMAAVLMMNFLRTSAPWRSSMVARRGRKLDQH